MNVFGAFDGISCAQISLEKAGIKVGNYYSSEIAEKPSSITRFNFPNTIELGDVTKITEEVLDSLPKIDLFIGGSPCQDLSSSNVWTEKKGLEGEKSKLFYEFVRILNYLKLKNKDLKFLLENVGSLKNSDKEVINEMTGVEGVKFNSKLLSAQNRNRIYWTNIDFEIPNERINVTLQEILEDKVADKYYLSQKMYDCVITPASKGWVSGKMEIDLEIARPLTATMHKMHRADTDNYVSTEYKPEGKTNVRRLTPIECERLQNIPDNYTQFGKDKEGKEVKISDTQRYMALGNGWTVDVIAHIFKGLKEDL